MGKLEVTKGTEQEKCFVIMPISDQGDYPEGHFDKIYKYIIKPAVVESGYVPYRVDEDKVSSHIVGKIFRAVKEEPMAICDLSNRNPNVLYELGLRHAYNRPVVLVQDDKTEPIFDVSGIYTVFYKSTFEHKDVLEAQENIKAAILAIKNRTMPSITEIVQIIPNPINEVETRTESASALLERLYAKFVKKSS